MKSTKRRLLSLVLALAVAVSSTAISAFAETTPIEGTNTTTPVPTTSAEPVPTTSAEPVAETQCRHSHCTS